MRSWPAILVAAGALLLGLTAAVLLVRGSLRPQARTTTVVRTVTQTQTVTTAPAPTPAPPVAALPFSWASAGGLIVNAADVDPTALGTRMRADGFGWVAVRLADGLTPAPPVAQWVQLFRAASGLPVGGWSVLRDDPVGEARLAAGAIAADKLDFFVANAELEYEYTNDHAHSGTRYLRSREFVQAFRALEPTLPAGLSSYCDPSLHDLDWSAWDRAGFAFLPQAYVSVLGAAGDPAACVAGASRWFPRADVHPSVGIFGGPYANPSPDDYGALLAAAQTRGFSLYPAETAQSEWESFGAVIRARPPVAALP